MRAATYTAIEFCQVWARYHEASAVLADATDALIQAEQERRAGMIGNTAFHEQVAILALDEYRAARAAISSGSTVEIIGPDVVTAPVRSFDPATGVIESNNIRYTKAAAPSKLYKPAHGGYPGQVAHGLHSQVTSI